MATKIKQFRWNYLGEYYPESWGDSSTNNDKVRVPLESTEKIIKIAIQAPVGTQIEIDDQKFLIGQFEILEFNCADIAIQNIYILGKEEAILNIEATQKAINDGLRLMDQALTNKLNSATTSITLASPEDAVNSDGVVTVTTEGENIETTLTVDTNTTIAAENAFIDEYTEGYNLYLSGLRGIYTTSTSGVSAVNNVLINVIIQDSEGGEN